MALVALPHDKDADLSNRLRQLYVYARDKKRTKYSNWERNYKLVNNKVGGKSSNSWYPSPRTSEIYPLLSSLVAWMGDQDSTIDITAAADPHSPFSNFMQQVANDLSAVMKANWQSDCYDTQVKLVLWDALIYGAGFFKSVWDQSLAGGLGNPNLIRVDPYALYLDPDSTSDRDGEFYIEVHKMSLSEIERRFPGTSAMLESLTGDSTDYDQRPTLSSETNLTPKANPGRLPSGDGRWGGVGVGPTTYNIPSIVVYEFWLRENDEWYDDDKKDVPDITEKHVADRWRVVVMAAGQILLDEYADQLWSHGSHPYTPYLFDDIGETYGISLVDHLAYPQLYINRLLASLQHNAELVGNPLFIEAANSGLDRVAIVNRPGTRLRLSGTAAMQNSPHWLEPPAMPDWVQELVRFWIDRMENVTGLTNAAREGLNRISDRTINDIQEAAFVRIRAGLRNLEISLQKAGKKIADLIIDNYTEPRYIAIIGPGGQKTSLVLHSRHFMTPTEKGAIPLEYSLQVTAGASMPTSRSARSARSDKAYALGIIDRQAWFEENAYPNWPIILDRITKLEQQGLFQPPGVRERNRAS